MANVAQVVAQKDWQNPVVFQRNRVNGHSPLNGFLTQEDAKHNANAQKQSLNGEWDFRLYPQPEAVTEDLLSEVLSDALLSCRPDNTHLVLVWQIHLEYDAEVSLPIPHRGIYRLTTTCLDLLNSFHQTSE